LQLTIFPVALQNSPDLRYGHTPSLILILVPLA
jgi:hypothetical protein